MLRVRQDNSWCGPSVRGISMERSWVGPSPGVWTIRGAWCHRGVQIWIRCSYQKCGRWQWQYLPWLPLSLKEWIISIVICQYLHHGLDNGAYINLTFSRSLGHTPRETLIVSLLNSSRNTCMMNPWGISGQGGPGRRQTNQILPDTSTFPLPDILINISDLHCDRRLHPDLFPVPFPLFPPLRNFSDGNIFFELGVGVISDCVSDSRVCCQTVFSIPTKNTNKQKIARALRTNNPSFNESYHASPRDPPSLAGKLPSHLSKTKNGLTCVHI